MTNENYTKFIIISVPPQEIRIVFEKMMQELCNIGNTYEAISYPPHITLRTGALVPVTEEEQFIKDFSNFLQPLKKISIISNTIEYSTYPSDNGDRYFVGYTIEKSEELMNLHKTLLSFNRYIKGIQNNFNPHLSLAYNDLTEEYFNQIKKHCSSEPERFERSYSWDVESVSLYSKKEGRWTPDFTHILI